MTQDIVKSTDVFRNLYKASNERSLNPDLYNTRLTLKGRIVTLVLYIMVVAVSFMYPVSGVVFYGVFREDRSLHAKTGLAIFLANLVFAIATHIIRVIEYA